MGKKFYKYLLTAFLAFIIFYLTLFAANLNKYYDLYTDSNSSKKSKIEYSLCKISNNISCYLDNNNFPSYFSYINNYFFEKFYKDLSNQKINSKIIIELWYEHNLQPDLINPNSDIKKTLQKSRRILYLLNHLPHVENNYFDESLKFFILKNILYYIEKHNDKIFANSALIKDIYNYALLILHKNYQQNLFLLKNQLFLVYTNYLKETKHVDCSLNNINGLKFLVKEIIFEKEKIKLSTQNKIINYENSLFIEALPLVNQIFRNNCKIDLLD